MNYDIYKCVKKILKMFTFNIKYDFYYENDSLSLNYLNLLILNLTHFYITFEFYFKKTE